MEEFLIELTDCYGRGPDIHTSTCQFNNTDTDAKAKVALISYIVCENHGVTKELIFQLFKREFRKYVKNKTGPIYWRTTPCASNKEPLPGVRFLEIRTRLFMPENPAVKKEEDILLMGSFTNQIANSKKD